jgi:localization factor PodJL
MREEKPRPAREGAALPPESPGRFATGFSPPPAESGSLRASFIAAARRATQSVVSAEDGPGRSAEPARDEGSEPGDDPEHDSERLVDRLKRTLDSHKRPLAYAWAALLLGCGAVPFAPGISHAPGPAEMPSIGWPTNPPAGSADSQLPFTPGAL